MNWKEVRLRTIVGTLVSLLLLSVGAFSQGAPRREPGIVLSFDAAAAQYVLDNPARALSDNRDEIWDSFEGYRITRVWHAESSVPVTWRVWERGLNRFLEDTSLTRRTLRLIDSLKSKIQREQSAVARHVFSYLGADTALEAAVFFVAFTEPYAFCVEHNKIGIDITGDEWHFDPDCVMNVLIHEIYHVGHRAITPDLTVLEADPVDGKTFVRFCYAYLQSEGMATYVAYRALDLYPSDYRHDDYGLLEDSVRVKQAIGQMNRMLTDAGTVAIDSMNKQAWDIGVMERVFYVAGAHIARTLEQKYGTEHLAGLVRSGSLDFIREYNQIVPGDCRIVFLEF